MTAALALLIALVAAGLVLEPLLRPARRGAAPLFPDSDDEDDPRLVRRHRALAALKEIAFDKATGKLSDEDFERMNAAFTAEALEAMREAESTDDVERLIASARGKSVKSTKFCNECGVELPASGRFCLECGAPRAAGV